MIFLCIAGNVGSEHAPKRKVFNPRCAEGPGALLGQFRHLHTDIYGNRGELIKQEIYIVTTCDYVR